MRLLALVFLIFGLACGDQVPVLPLPFASLNRDTVEQSLGWAELDLEAQVRWCRESLYLMAPGQTVDGSPSYHLVLLLETRFRNTGSARHGYLMRLACFTDQLGFTIGCAEAPGSFSLEPGETLETSGHLQIQVADLDEANAIGRVTIDIQASLPKVD